VFTQPACAAELDALARSSGFSGAIEVHVQGDAVFARAYGLADRAHRILNTIETRFGIASG
jgi:CubicO group peptidase (beta-lactamase class C family)